MNPISTEETDPFVIMTKTDDELFIINQDTEETVQALYPNEITDAKVTPLDASLGTLTDY